MTQAHVYRRDDPDETEGRRLYRIAAEAQARRDMAIARQVRLRPAVEKEGNGL